MVFHRVNKKGLVYGWQDGLRGKIHRYRKPLSKGFVYRNRKRTFFG